MVDPADRGREGEGLGRDAKVTFLRRLGMHQTSAPGPRPVVELQQVDGVVPPGQGLVENGDKEPVLARAAQKADRTVGERAGGEGHDHAEAGAGAVEKVVVAFRADGDAEEGDIAVGAEDAGQTVERGGREEAGEVDGEVGEERRARGPEGEAEDVAALGGAHALAG